MAHFLPQRTSLLFQECSRVKMDLPTGDMQRDITQVQQGVINVNEISKDCVAEFWFVSTNRVRWSH